MHIDAVSTADASLALAEARYRSLLEAALDEIFVFSRDGRLSYLNAAAAARLGKPSGELMGRAFVDVFPPALAAATGHEIQTVRSTRAPAYSEQEFAFPDGRTSWMSVWFVPLDPEGTLLGIARDITARKLAELAVLESRERFRLIAESIEEVFWLASGSLDEIEYVSPNCLRLWPWSAEALHAAPSRFFDAIHDADRERVRAIIRAACEAAKPFDCEYRIVRAPGETRWAWHRGFPVHAEAGGPLRYVCTALDITGRKLAEEQLQKDAATDRLTGLANRACLSEALRGDRRRSDGRLFAVLFIDFDEFKLVNDTWGHDVGDELLIQAAQRLQLCVRPGDTLARLGGDEFVVIAEGLSSASDAADIAGRIQKSLQQEFLLGDQQISLTASIGIAVNDDDEGSARNLLRNADTAMYRAKGRGKGYWEVFNRGMHTQVVRRMDLTTKLKTALREQQFRVLYQPIVDVRTGSVSGVEALLRWQHPTRGLLEPAQFMSVAEEMGLMLPIGDWVLQTACTDALRWRATGLRPIRVAVNLSPSQFRNPSFVERVAHTLERVGLDPRALELELSESIIFGQGHSTLAELRRLTRLGIQLAVDDFGAAHSSLRWLLALPVATIKIDKSFIRDVPLDLTGAQVMKALIGLAHGLQLRVVAEGIETPEQEEFIEAHGADEMQGFYVSGLLTADEVSALLEQTGRLGWSGRSPRADAALVS